MKPRTTFCFGLLIGIVFVSFFIVVNLIPRKEFSGEVIKEMDPPPDLPEVITEAKAPSCQPEIIQETGDPLSVLFNNTWLSAAEPRWWMKFEGNLIMLGPYEGGIDLLEKFEVVEVDAEKRSIVIHVTEFRWLHHPDCPDEVEQRDDLDRLTLEGKTMIYEHKFESNEAVTTIWTAM